MKASRIREPAASLPITRERASAGLHIVQPSRIRDSLAAPMTAVPASRVLGQMWQGYVRQTVPTEFQISRPNPEPPTPPNEMRNTPATPTPGLGSRRLHLRRDWAHGATRSDNSIGALSLATSDPARSAAAGSASSDCRMREPIGAMRAGVADGVAGSCMHVSACAHKRV